MKKLKLSDLQAKPKKVMLKHPEMGDIDAYVMVTPTRSTAYFLKAVELNKKDSNEKSVQEKIKENAELCATLVVDWDKDFFEMDCTIENVTKVFSLVENFWIRDQVTEEAAKLEDFFQKL